MTERRARGRKPGKAAQAERVLALLQELRGRRAFVPLRELAEKPR